MKHNFFFNLSATVTNLQQKLESVQTTNTLLKEDLAIAKNTALDLQDENDRLKADQGSIVDDTKKQLEVGPVCSPFLFKEKIFNHEIHQFECFPFPLILSERDQLEVNLS